MVNFSVLINNQEKFNKGIDTFSEITEIPSIDSISDYWEKEHDRMCTRTYIADTIFKNGFIHGSLC